MRKAPGTVHDIRTGRAITHTDSFSDTFATHVQVLLESGQPFFVVSGRCHRREIRHLVSFLRSLQGMGFSVVYDARMPSDRLYIFDGHPAELGFAC